MRDWFHVFTDSTGDFLMSHALASRDSYAQASKFRRRLTNSLYLLHPNLMRCLILTLPRPRRANRHLHARARAGMTDRYFFLTRRIPVGRTERSQLYRCY